MTKDIRVSFALDRHGQSLIRKAAKATKMTVSEYIRETVLREAGEDARKRRDE